MQKKHNQNKAKDWQEERWENSLDSGINPNNKTFIGAPIRNEEEGTIALYSRVGQITGQQGLQEQGQLVGE